MTKIISWNVNGIRAWYKKGALEELLKEKPDVFCFQETKAHQDQLPQELKNVPGYKSFFDHSKGRKGYSGVAVYVKNTLLCHSRGGGNSVGKIQDLDQEYFSGEKFPDHDSTRQSPSLRSETLLSSPRIHEDDNAKSKSHKSSVIDYKLPVDYGLGIPELDQEGRFLAVHLKDFTIITCYFPNAGTKPERLEFKMKFYDAFLAYVEKLKKKQPNIIFCGDVNTAHNEIDLSRPKENEKHTGFLRIERDWIDKVVKKGWIDSFRHLHPNKVQFSWWDMKTFARSRNIGWRIDYFFVSPALEPKIKKAEILDQIFGSDHCPIELVISP
jgi:exodeoxyribonuclease-3